MKFTASCAILALLFVVATSILPPKCAGGRNPVQCFDPPCEFGKCPNFPNAFCTNDTCGGCKARFFARGIEVTSECGACTSLPVQTCENRVFCFERPCSTGSCPLVPQATCYDDYCGGCNRRWFLPDCTEITRICERTTGYG